MEMLTKNIALEVANSKIRINGIESSAIATDMNKEMHEDDRREEEKNTPMRRIGPPRR